jgi:DNA-binding transcriptional LysR family regulator
MLKAQQLETFYWAAKLGSFSAAATRLRTTQSAVSMRIRELERHLGTALFDRIHRAAVITAKGRELLEYAEQILRLSLQAEERIATGKNTPIVVRIGCAEVVSITWLPQFIRAVHASYPQLRLELDEALTQDLIERLEQGSLDLVLAPGKPVGRQFLNTSLGRVTFSWMASPSLDLPRRPLGPRDLQDWPVIALTKESHHHAAIEEWFAKAGATCRRIDTCKSISVAASLAASGLGITYLPVRCYEQEIADGKLMLVRTTPALPPVEFTATTPTDIFDPFVRRLADLAAQISDFNKSATSASQAKARKVAKTLLE